MDYGGGGGASKLRGGKFTGKVRNRSTVAGGLMLASMLDILMAILFFLLKNYSTVTADFNIGKDLSLPQSQAVQAPVPALQLVVTQKAILLDDKPLIEFVNNEIPKSELHSDGLTIVKLAQALKEQKDRSLYIEQRNDAHSFTGTIVLQADKNLPFSLLKRVLYTTGVSDFAMLKLAVLKKEPA